MRLQLRWRHSVVSRAAALLPSAQRTKLFALVAVQVFLGALDLVAVGLVGILGTLSVAGVQARAPQGIIARMLWFLHLDSVPAQTQVAVLAGVTCALFMVRTAASIYLTRRALHFLGYRMAEASSALVSALLSKPLTYLQARGTQEYLYGVTSGVNALVLGVLGTIVVMAADASMLLAISVLLIVVSPVVALVLGVLLFAFVAALHRFTTGRAASLGTLSARMDVARREVLVEALSTYRDMHVRGSQSLYAERARELGIKAAYVASEWAFLPNVSKYMLESAVIMGSLLVGGLEFALHDAGTAVGALAVFLAAGMRLAPAIIRLQQGAISLRGNIGQAAQTLTLMDELELDRLLPQHPGFSDNHPGFLADLEVRELSFAYPSAGSNAVEGLSFSARHGSLVAFVGPSGAGKSTAADLILGVLEPSGGKISIGGMSPQETIEHWPGAIGYVPQDIWIADDSIRGNVTLGFNSAEVPDDLVWQALELARLADLVRGMPDRLATQVGERGAKLSGGQRQRLGIARALLSRPGLVVLDEATSALDAETEFDISSALQRLRGSVTLVVIAHRLAIVREADQVVYFENGRVPAIGTFDEVRRLVPDFDRQAKLLGL